MTYTEELRFRQDRFARHFQYLLAFIRSETDLTLSIGDVSRTPEQQSIYVSQGLSKTTNSMHLKRLAVDLNFFDNDYYVFSDTKRLSEDMQLIATIGDYWETLDQDNRWGGRFRSFPDPMHFEQYFP